MMWLKELSFLFLFVSIYGASVNVGLDGLEFISSGMAPDSTNAGSSSAHNNFIVSRKGVSEQDKVNIVNLHNKYRRIIGRHATNMMKVVWDDNIAVSAQRHAESCWFHHDDLSNRWTSTLPGVYIGQNMCAGNTGWADCVKAWYDEKDNYQYGSGTKTLTWMDIGHYTQLASWHAARIGCGYAECEGRADRTSFVCNYAYGQYYRDLIQPYTNGTICADCRGRCDNGLCDCGGKICNNFGTLNLETCTCVCLPYYSGQTCEQSVCNVAEHDSCSRHPTDECLKGVNIAALCPRHCGRC